MPKIKKIMAREILDSRGNPTIETKVELDNGISAKASVPSGASTGEHEAYELRDGDKKRYDGLGVLKAVGNVNSKIFKALAGKEIIKQEEIDREMIKLDGTDDKSKLGANAILSVSLACVRASANVLKKELYEYLAKAYGFDKSPRPPLSRGSNFRMPIPFFNIFNGGKHADTNLDFQEFMIVPIKKVDFSEKVRMGAEIFHELGRVLKKAGFDTDVGSEGGYAPDIVSSIQAIELILAAILEAGYTPGKDIGLGIDVGSSELYNQKAAKYIFKLDQANFTNTTLVGLYYEWFRKYPIISLEDGLAEDDWEGWRELTKELGEEMLIVGDDLFATNINRLRQGLKEKAANTILIKPNQVGTLTETMECVKFAQKHNYNIMVSHRSGETSDDFIADLAVAVGADYIKAGSLSRGERVAKYNRLMEIEDNLK
ncbi:MAG: phosphopyruvate hydratase [Patescibacteria group bacterium]|nr:phosphopyruvate hydratase [Patescibacteria group bacterium]MDD5294818.1 phosphopyruvate hydratase [Patescibacteria group bacterium]MDD5554793.1 phosphopyruvate hydratase [Patescibacteria group bacterium]